MLFLCFLLIPFRIVLPCIGYIHRQRIRHVDKSVACMCKKYYDFIIWVLNIKYNSYFCEDYSSMPA